MTEEIIIERGCNYCNENDKDTCYLVQLKQAENTVKECHKYQAELEDEIDRLEQENKELRAEIELFMNGDYCANGCKKMNNAFCDAHTIIINENNKLRSALEKIKDLCIHYENTDDKCITNCYAHFIVTDLIQDKINEVLNNEA